MFAQNWDKLHDVQFGSDAHSALLYKNAVLGKLDVVLSELYMFPNPRQHSTHAQCSA